MTDMDARLAHDRDLSTDADLEDQLGLLLSPATNPRQLWLVFLDAENRHVGPFMPCDDYPDDPAHPVQTEDLGRRTFADVLAHRLHDVLEMLGAASVVLVWERPGNAMFSREDRRWARAMVEACRGADVPLRAQLRLHDDGARVIRADDYLGG